MQGKNAIMRSPSCPPPDVVKQGWLAIIGILNRLEEVIRMVGLAKVVLYVIVLRRDAKFDEFVLECPRLLKEAMDFPFDFHICIKIYKPPACFCLSHPAVGRDYRML